MATPQFSPAAGTYSAAQDVTITTATSGATIRYTTDGSTPTETTGTAYAAPVHITESLTLKAVAYRSDWTTSSVTSGSYTITNGPEPVDYCVYVTNCVTDNISAYTINATTGALTEIAGSPGWPAPRSVRLRAQGTDLERNDEFKSLGRSGRPATWRR